MNVEPKPYPQTNDGVMFKLEAIYRDLRQVAEIADSQARYIEEKSHEFAEELERIRRGKMRRG